MQRDNFEVGDIIRITTRTSGESKVHATPFEGMVIAMRGTGTGKTFTVRKIAADKIAVERIFPLDSPAIESLKVLKHNKVRRAKLYYMRKSLNA